MDNKKRVFDLIKRHKGKLIRQTASHLRYEFPNGKKCTVSIGSTSDESRGWINNYHELCRLLGLQEYATRSNQVTKVKKKRIKKNDLQQESVEGLGGKTGKTMTEALLTSGLLHKFAPEADEQNEKKVRGYRKYGRAPSHSAVRVYDKQEIERLNNIARVVGTENVSKILNQQYLENVVHDAVPKPKRKREENFLSSTKLAREQVKEWEELRVKLLDDITASEHAITEANKKIEQTKKDIKELDDVLEPAKLMLEGLEKNPHLFDKSIRSLMPVTEKKPRAKRGPYRERVSFDYFGRIKSMLNEKGPMKSADIMRELEQQAGRSVPRQSVYSAIHRMFKEGNIERENGEYRIKVYDSLQDHIQDLQPNA